MAISVNPTEEMVQCEVCGKDIPASGARAAQSAGATAYFCGIECYVEWKEDEARGDEGGKGA